MSGRADDRSVHEDVLQACPDRPGKRKMKLHKSTFEGGIFCMAFLGGVALMAAGCFVPSSARMLLLYEVCLAVYAIAYFYYYVVVAPPRQAFFNWVCLLFLFPKKAVRGEYNVLLSAMFGHRSFSFYEILDVIMIGTLAAILLTRPTRESNGRRPWKPFSAVFWSSCLMAAVGLLHLGLCLAGLGSDPYNGLEMWRALWPLLEGIVIWMASGRFIRSQEDIGRIFLVGFLGAGGLVCEFLVSKYTSLLPGRLLYFEFDPQLGNFRSAWESSGAESGLLVGQLLIVGIGCACGRLLLRRPMLATASVLSFLLVILYTYNRGSLVAGFMAVIIIMWLATRRWRHMMIVLLILAVFAIRVDWEVKGHLVHALGLENVKTAESSFFGGNSLFQRIGAQMRATEVFLDMPLLGAGPGRLGMQMANPAVPQIFNMENFNDSIQGMYRWVMDPEHMTNSHNLGTDLIAEYGLCGLSTIFLFLLTMAWVGWALARPSRIRLSPRKASYGIAAYGALAGMCVYYCTQAIPLQFGLLAMLLRMVVVAREEQPDHLATNRDKRRQMERKVLLSAAIH